VRQAYRWVREWNQQLCCTHLALRASEAAGAEAAGATRDTSEAGGAGRAGSTTISIFIGRSVVDVRVRFGKEIDIR
jgi:hypothetical protein